MRICRATCDYKPCSLPVEEYGYCKEHRILERGLYYYYKAHEVEYEYWDRQRPRESTSEIFQRCHKHLMIAICARILHGRWFYEGRTDDGHQDYLRTLKCKSLNLDDLIWLEGFAIIGLETIGDRIMACLEQEVLKVGSDWRKEDVLDRYRDMPSIEVTSQGTPGSWYHDPRPDSGDSWLPSFSRNNEWTDDPPVNQDDGIIW